MRKNREKTEGNAEKKVEIFKRRRILVTITVWRRLHLNVFQRNLNIYIYRQVPENICSKYSGIHVNFDKT